MASYMEAASAFAQVLGTGFGIYSHRKTLEQELKLHDHELAVTTEQHFSALSTDLLAIAKEADRDVWEQRNEQFNQMLVCAVLMFGISVGNINEGTYQFDAVTDKHGYEVRALVSKDGMFVLLTGVSISSLFLCIVACLLVMRRMSTYMIERSSNLVDRLAVSTGLAHQISGAAQQQHDIWNLEDGAPNLEEILGREKRRFHAKMGAAIGSGPKEAKQRHGQEEGWKTYPNGLNAAAATKGYVPPPLPPASSRLPASLAQYAPRSTHHANRIDEETESDSSDGYQSFKDSPQTAAPAGPSPPRSRITAPPLLHSGIRGGNGLPGHRIPPTARTAPLNFGIFYRDHCRWLAMAVTWTFVIGTLSAWSSVWFLLWNQARAQAA